ncbi:FAD-dependent oxidoreductase [Pigmentiphaga aceris]|uniref:FAD-dependent oxidoreductase n=1 Tax=Pigmentiphaga aceris TaxID=1940612 RepID=A0A5C0AT23_9BURK|nr:FAD-dependent oxidoreductase [Pigmentiphaga aceris]QEI05225.1 FAD-dependent oxidoreductase [Pigmentiphaga aceris]
MEPGRRAFFLPGRAQRDPWAQFCQRLSRLVAGKVEDESATSGGQTVHRARLIAARAADIHHARALCAELGVVLADAHAGLSVDAARSWLWADSSRLNGVGAFDSRLGLISVEAGCQVGSLRDALAGSPWLAPGLNGANPNQTLGQWLLTADHWLPGECAASNLHAVDVMLADGGSEQLGSFGHAATRPLSQALRALVSGLFETAASPAATAMRAQPRWPGHYRLDALLPLTPAGLTPIPNLAHLLLGSRGSLAWVERIHLRLHAEDVPSTQVSVPQGGTPVRGLDQQMEPGAVRHIDAYVKSRFDPETRLPAPFV